MYEKAMQDIYGVFASSAWTSLNYPAYPSNYSGVINTESSFVRITVLPNKGGLDTFSFGKVINGLLIISIFDRAGNGDAQIFKIADNLDDLFEGKTLTNGTQFGPSSITNLGLDTTDNNYYRGDYIIYFKIHGE